MNLSSGRKRDHEFAIGYNKVKARSMLFFLVSCEVFLVAFYILVYIIAPDVSWGPVSILIDLERDLSIPSWFSTVQLFGAAVILFATSRAAKRYRWFYTLSSVILVLLSIDEGTGIHEKVTKFAEVLDIAILQAVMISGHGAWIVPYAILGLLIVFITIKPILETCRYHTEASLYVGLGVLLVIVGAVGLEAVSYVYLRDGAEVAYMIEVASEEFCEMLGVSLALYGILIFSIEMPHTFIGGQK